MTTPLTRDPSIHIEKTAFDVKLEREPDDWAAEIISQAYKSLPFLKDYEMDAELERVDGSRGFGIGKLLVYPMGMEKDAAIKQNNMVVFPLIIREERMSPFDVFSHSGQLKPMTKEAVERALFRPDVFAGPARKGEVGGTDLQNQIGPPTSSTNRHAGGALFKQSSVLARDEDREAVLTKIANHPGLRRIYGNHPYLSSAVLVMNDHKEKTASDIRVQRRLNTPPDAIQIIEDGAGYLVKHANSKCFRPVVERRDSFEVERMIGKEKMAQLREDGSLLITVNPTAKAADMRKEAQIVETIGVYKALIGTAEIPGVVVPRTVSLEGDVLDEGVFAGVNTHGFAKVAGVHLKDITLMPCAPSGTGVFVYQRGPEGVATEPLTITNRVSESAGKEKVASYLAVRDTGQQVKLTPVEGLRMITKIASSEYAIPAEMVFLPLRGKRSVINENPQDFTKIAHAKVASGRDTIALVGDGLSFGISGWNASNLPGREMLSKDQAAFYLASLGVPSEHVPGIMKKASIRPVKIPGTRPVVREDQALDYMRKQASSVLPSIDTIDLISETALMVLPAAAENAKKINPILDAMGFTKEASSVIDKETVDAVLSLNFLTPENVSVYVEALPALEKSANKLAEIVVASRMGMDDVRESAATRAMKSLSEVIDGLNSLGHKIQ